MASSRGAEEAQVETGTADVSQQSRSTVTNTTTAGAQQSSSTQVEMTDLPSQQQRLDDHNPAETAAAHHDTTTTDPPQSTSHNSVPLTRSQTEALGPSTEGPIPLPPSNPNRGPTLSISLMLTTGARHPYKIDSKYLRARNVALGNTNKKSGGSVKEGKGKEDGNVDPREVLSGYKLKELIWTDWRSEWEARPASPSFIRLIIMGRMLDDKAALKDFPFSLDTVNVVHMTVKPADLVDDEAEATGKGPGKSSLRGRDGDDGGAGCKCVIL